MRLLAAQGVLQPLTGFFQEQNRDNAYFSNIFDAAAQNGTIFWFSPSFNLQSFQCPAALVEGKEKISTLEEFDAIFQELGQDAYDSSLKEVWLSALFLDGCEQFVDYEAAAARFETQAFYDILAFCNRFAAEQEDLQAGAHPPLFHTMNNMSLQTLYRADARTEEDTPYGPEAAFLPMPFSPYDGLGITGTYYAAIPAGAANPDAAQALGAFLLSEEAQDTILDTPYALPVLRSAYDRLFDQYALEPDDPTLERLLDLISGADHYSDVFYHPIYGIIRDEADAYFAGMRSAEETAALIQNRVELYLAEQ